MPTSYVNKLAKKHGVSTGKSEAEWAKAKKQAAKEGKGENFAYITAIYKKIMGENAKTISLKDFLFVTEMTDTSEISYGRDRNEPVDDEFSDDFSDEDQDSLDAEDRDEDYNDVDQDEDFDQESGHRLKGIVGPDEMDDSEDELDADSEFDDEDQDEDLLGDEEDQGEGVLGDDEDEYRGGEEASAPMRKPRREEPRFEGYDVPKLSMLKELMIITEKKGKTIKKAAKSVYHRDYVKTKSKPYRKYHPEHKDNN